MNTSITIASRFCGPPTSGNGGYSCGMLDKETDYMSEVTLRRPIPLDLAMEIKANEEQLQLLAGEELIASVRPGNLDDLKVPPYVDFQEALASSEGCIAHQERPAFPTCFVCGIDRAAGDGLRIFAGASKDKDIYAAPWRPAEDLADAEGWVQPEFIWAALDCPGAFAIMKDQIRTIVLGRLTAALIAPVKAGEDCVVTAWSLGGEGRKFFSGTAVFNAAGELCAKAKAVWIEIDKH